MSVKKKPRSKTKKSTRPFVVVRTYSAGVHLGELVSREGTEVHLANASRLWRWRGANSLHEVATRGVSQDWTRISDRVESIVLTGAIEIIQAEPAAVSTFAPRWPS